MNINFTKESKLKSIFNKESVVEARKRQKENQLTKFLPSYQNMTSQERILKAINIASDDGRCWWIKKYLTSHYRVNERTGTKWG